MSGYRAKSVHNRHLHNNSKLAVSLFAASLAVSFALKATFDGHISTIAEVAPINLLYLT